MKIGVIAEEYNDVEILYELTCKLISNNAFSFKKFIGHGCGKLRIKCTAWAANLFGRGCTHLVVIHDLDENHETALRSELNKRVQNIGFTEYVILIPIREIEAWLLTDAKALQTVFAMNNTPKLPGRPEIINDPKKRLRDIVWKSSKKRYLHTIHNKKIAAALQISKVMSCKSFHPYPEFIKLHKTR